MSLFWCREKEALQRSLENFSVKNPEVNLRILVFGQIGAGKSSFINSVNSALQGRIVCEALSNSTLGASQTFTRRVGLLMDQQYFLKTKPLCACNCLLLRFIYISIFYLSFQFQTFHICNKNGKLSFVFGDIAGLEGSLSGLQVDDVISTILGHVKENYKVMKCVKLNTYIRFVQCMCAKSIT